MDPIICPSQWSGEVVKRMHLLRLTNLQLAEMVGYTPQYVSMILNGKRDTQRARVKIEGALTFLEAH